MSLYEAGKMVAAITIKSRISKISKGFRIQKIDANVIEQDI